MIYMNKEFYMGLLNEMWGDQQLVLMKTRSIRGLKIIIDNLDSEFIIKSTINEMVVKY